MIYNFNTKYIYVLKICFCQPETIFIYNTNISLCQTHRWIKGEASTSDKHTASTYRLRGNHTTESGILGRSVLIYVLVIEKIKNKYYLEALILELHTFHRIV
jgi:hypothetical protein